MRGSVFKRCTCPVRRDERGRVLSKALNDAVRDDLLLVSPTVKAVPPGRQRYEAAIWNAEQAQQATQRIESLLLPPQPLEDGVA